ncbi:Lysine methyltransferase [Parasponia andersonii]|uniref:Lysine methyltransferase n=1 Tax=Parasponia andersonii TaxID=3476 RepID=A0A2P5DQY3_PARAD|nr:Lysine methyltransferase [Parasponia andersonii]
METEEEEENIVCLDESFFINDNYQLTEYTFGSHVIKLLCLQSASTDFDLTGQLVWPGAMLLNDYLAKNADLLRGCSVLELGSGVGITGILCSRFCREVVLTDHNDEVLKARMDSMVLNEAKQQGLQINVVVGTRQIVGNLEGVIFEVTL